MQPDANAGGERLCSRYNRTTKELQRTDKTSDTALLDHVFSPEPKTSRAISIHQPAHCMEEAFSADPCATVDWMGVEAEA